MAGLLKSGQWIITLLSGGAALALLIFFGSREFTRVLDGWAWQNAQESTATVQNVVPIPEGGSGNIAFGKPGKNDGLLVAYRYPVGDRELSAQLKMSAAEKNAAGGEPPATFLVYYQPGDPGKHVAHVDPRPRFWQAAQRMGIVLALSVVALITAIFLLRNYGRSERTVAAAPDKLDWPQA
jgi:hypothetical protein